MNQVSKVPSYVITGQSAIQHAVIHGTTLYSFMIGGPIPLPVAMRMNAECAAALFIAVDSLPGMEDRQMMTVPAIEDTRAFVRRKVAAFEEDEHRRAMRTLAIIAISIVVVCIVFSACLILPRLF